MNNLLDAPALFVAPDGRPHGGAIDMIITEPDGSTLVRARDRVRAVERTFRVLGLKGRTSSAEWDVVDGNENRMLVVTKPRHRTRTRVLVSLADGTPLGGAAEEAGPGPIKSVALLAIDDSTVGSLRGALGERRTRPILLYRVCDESDHQVGEILHESHDPWGFHLRFEPDASTQIRALAIAQTLCLVQQRLAGSRV